MKLENLKIFKKWRISKIMKNMQNAENSWSSKTREFLKKSSESKKSINIKAINKKF